MITIIARLYRRGFSGGGLVLLSRSITPAKMMYLLEMQCKIYIYIYIKKTNQ